MRFSVWIALNSWCYVSGFVVLVYSRSCLFTKKRDKVRNRRDVLANSASRGSRRKPNSVSSRALKTSAGDMVFLPAFTVFSLALGIKLVWSSP